MKDKIIDAVFNWIIWTIIVWCLFYGVASSVEDFKEWMNKP